MTDWQKKQSSHLAVESADADNRPRSDLDQQRSYMMLLCPASSPFRSPDGIYMTSTQVHTATKRVKYSQQKNISYTTVCNCIRVKRSHTTALWKFSPLQECMQVNFKKAKTHDYITTCVPHKSK